MTHIELKLNQIIEINYEHINIESIYLNEPYFLFIIKTISTFINITDDIDFKNSRHSGTYLFVLSQLAIQ